MAGLERWEIVERHRLMGGSVVIDFCKEGAVIECERCGEEMTLSCPDLKVPQSTLEAAERIVGGFTAYVREQALRFAPQHVHCSPKGAKAAN